MERTPETQTGFEQRPPMRRMSEGARVLKLTPWLPVPILLAATVGLWLLDLRVSYISYPLRVSLNFVFFTLISAFVAFLAGRGFLLRGMPAELLLGCGALLWGGTGLIAFAGNRSNVNAMVTLYSAAWWFAAACHLAGALLSIRPRRPMRVPAVWLAAVCTGLSGLLFALWYAAFAGWLPVFFVPGRGATPWRHATMFSTVAMFAAAALVLRVAHRQSMSPFLNWYTLGLILIGTGILGTTMSVVRGGPLYWLGLLGQCLGSVYMLIATAVPVRDSKEWGISLEASLAAVQVRLESLLDLAADGILVYEFTREVAGRTFIQVNAAFCKMTGRTADELSRLTPLDVVLPEEREDLMRVWKIVAREGFVRHEKTLISTDGRRVPAEIHSRLFQDRGRAMMMSVVRDVTERRQAEEQVRELSQRLTYHVNNSPLAVVEWGPDMRLTRWSASAERIFGWEAGEVLGKRIEDFHWVYEEDEPRVSEVAGSLRDGLAKHRQTSNRNYRKDGTVVECEWYNSALRDPSGRLRSILSLVLDVTERKRAEEALRESEARFQAFMNASPAVIWIKDESGRYVNVNGAWEAAYGLKCEEWLGKTESGLADGATVERVACEDAEVLRTGKPLEKIEQSGGTMAGEPRYWHVVKFAFRGWSGQPLLGGMATEVTAQKRAEDRLRHAQKLESIGLLAGGIAHDFNNLLVGVIGNASLAHDMLPKGHPASELLEQVVKSGEHAAHLTRQMLAYSGKGRFVVDLLNLSNLVADIEELVRPSIPNRVAVKLDLDPALPPVRADSGQIQQVIMNLLINAGEAIGNQTGLISVRTGVRAIGEWQVPDGAGSGDLRPGNYAYLEVRDTGCGMDGATRAKIFDPFFTTKFTGRGLGLAAVAGIVRGHNGSIEVASEPGVGSCFVVLFPAAEAGAVAAAGATAPARQDLRGSGTVLVVDDEDLVRDLARRALENHGFTVLPAGGGVDAIETFRRECNRIAAVILDVSMPGMSGSETLVELRKIRGDVKVVASSGYSEGETRELFCGQTLAGFVQKPYTANRLVEVLKSVIG